MTQRSTAFGRATKLLAFAVVLALQASPGHGQMFKYNNPSEIIGAAAVSPTSCQQLLRRLISFCEADTPALKKSAEAALDGWASRHASYLKRSAEIHARMLVLANDPQMPQSLRDQIKNNFEQVVPKTIDSQFEAFASPVRAMTSPAGRSTMCTSYVKAIAEGEFDLKRNDPTLTAWFDGTLQTIAPLAPPSPSSAAAKAGASTDAVAP